MIPVNTCETSPSSPCSGRGVCVNVSSTLSACLCDAESWTGANDMFDMRITEMVPGGEKLAMDCTQSSIGTIVAWSFFLLFVVIRGVQNVRALLEQIERKRPSGWRDLVREMRFRALVGDLLTTIPLAAAAAIMKIVTARSNQALVIGTDPGVTVIFVVSIWCGLAWVLDFMHVQFLTLVRSQIDLKGTRKSLYRISTILNLLTFSSYFMLNVLPTVVALGVDKSLGPWTNNEFVIIIVRNVGVMGWQVFQLAGSRYLGDQIEKIRQFASLQHNFNNNNNSNDQQGQSPPSSTKHQSLRANGQKSPSRNPLRSGQQQGSSTQLTAPISSSPQAGASPAATDGRLEAIVEMMDKRRRDLLKTNVVVFLAYSTFTIPYLFPYQTYCLSVLAALGMLTNPGRALHSIYSASKAATTLSNSSKRVAAEKNTNSKGSRTGTGAKAGGSTTPSNNPGSVSVMPQMSAGEEP